LDCSPARASSNQRRPPSPPADCQDALAAPSSGGMDAPAALHSSLRVTEVDIGCAARSSSCSIQIGCIAVGEIRAALPTLPSILAAALTRCPPVATAVRHRRPDAVPRPLSKAALGWCLDTSRSRCCPTLAACADDARLVGHLLQDAYANWCQTARYLSEGLVCRRATPSSVQPETQPPLVSSEPSSRS